MNSNDTFQLICELFKKRKINSQLINKLEQKKVSDLKSTVKLYLLKFLIDPDDKTAHIYNKNDLWFIKENAENIDIINKYILLLYNIIKKDNISNIDIIKEIEPFIDTNVGTKIIYIISILNKLNLQKIIYLLFLGFIIGEKKDFIKRNYLMNIKDLLSIIEPEISDTQSDIHIYYLNDNALEILNLYVFFNKFLSNEINYIYSLRNALNTKDSPDFNKYQFYNKLIKEGLIDTLFFKEENNIISNVYKNKVVNMMQIIKKNVENYNKMNQDLFKDDLSNNEEFLKEFNEGIDLEEKEIEERRENNEEDEDEANEDNEKEDMEKENIEDKSNLFIDKIKNSTSINNINLKNEKPTIKEENQIQTDAENDNNQKTIPIIKENKIQNSRNYNKESLSEISDKEMEIVGKNINVNTELLTTKNNKEINNDSLIETHDNSGEKSLKMDFQKIPLISHFQDKTLDNIKDYINYPSLDVMNIQEDEEENDDKRLFIGFSFYLMLLGSKKERLNHILKSSIFDMFSKYSKIINDSKFRIFRKLRIFQIRRKLCSF